jgi:hypothetical protein
MCLLWGTNWVLYPRRRQFSFVPAVKTSNNTYYPSIWLDGQRKTIISLILQGLCAGSHMKCPPSEHMPVDLSLCESSCFASGILIPFIFSMGLEWNQVHYYWANLLAYYISPGWQKVVIVEQLVEWMSGRGNRSSGGKPWSSAALSIADSTWLERGWNRGRRSGKPEINRLRYGNACFRS